MFFAHRRCLFVSLSDAARCRILLGLADGGKSNKLELIEASTAGFVDLKRKSTKHMHIRVTAHIAPLNSASYIPHTSHTRTAVLVLPSD